MLAHLSCPGNEFVILCIYNPINRVGKNRDLKKIKKNLIFDLNQFFDLNQIFLYIWLIS